MSNVYVVYDSVPYEGLWIYGIYDTQEKAEKRVAASKDPCWEWVSLPLGDLDGNEL